ncbi:hypothetical protein [Aeromonas cavernicola]|uniref:Uncharacterized protein n=1 Tax=Aeromonas cavernicola TaxID=1006623 RepID=A0A2H9U6I0_9GAMM|nr:hypothetical protein [Aeromonas cavernicola]PJG59640.1 hypothetical protein CUC53_06225 [Aeromonas cavernicola]
MIHKLSDIVSKNRAEEFPDDLWGLYVLPLDYETANLHKLTKGSVIVGGRGSGKTMYLKYHCHATMFSKNRFNLPQDIFTSIGIYWKPDTAFTQIINNRWLSERWLSAFNTYSSLCILIEFSKLIKNINSSNIENIDLINSLASLYLPDPISEEIKCNRVKLIDADKILESCLYKITNWINSPFEKSPDYNIEPKNTFDIISKHIQQSHELLRNTTFHIFIDEFENLSQEQQKIINTWLKHGRSPTLYSIAYKKHANVSNDTLSQEKIVELNDYRIIDLEQLYLDDNSYKNYEILASEILALKLTSANKAFSPIYTELIKSYSDPSFLTKRRENKEYQSALITHMNGIFQSMAIRQLSQEIIIDSTLKGKLVNGLIVEGLKKHDEKKLNAFDFINDKYPEASLVNGVLLNRTSMKPSILKNKFDELTTHDVTGDYKGWIDNNLYGVILYIYNTLPKRVCPLYVGFNQFVLMSKGNLRHFLELCYQTFLRAENQSEDGNIDFPINIAVQGKATLATSTTQLEKIEQLGSNGIHLKRLAKRLGVIFTLSQNRKSQSEPEINHFSIALSDISLLDEDTQKLLTEASIWSVLFPTKSTKIKSSTDTEMIDYILHPMLSCYFGISPRKKRKLRFNAEHIRAICYGKEDEFKSLVSKYSKQWDIASDEGDQTTKLLDQNGQYRLL